MRPIDPHHPKSESGKAQETAKAGKLAGRRSPHQPAQVENSLCSHLFRGSLDQFALDPSKPIEKFKITEAWKFPRSTVENHPYLHMFPDLELLTKNTKVEKQNQSIWPDVIYSGYGQLGNVTEIAGGRYFTAIDPISYFIYHPWFEQIYMGESRQGNIGLLSERVRLQRNPDHPYFGRPQFRNPYIQYGPYWFGKSSTRGVLSDTIARMMKEAAYPTAHLMPLTWQTGGRIYERITPGKAVIEYNWKLDEYIRTTVSRYSHDIDQVNFPSSQTKYNVFEGFHKNYIAPEIKWEFVHPKLPIIRVTAQNSKVLPLTLPGTENPGPTEYSVSFVISFQNRWESLDDPNRWD